MHSIVILLCAISCSEHSTQVDSTEDPLKSNEHDIVKIIAHKGFWRSDQSQLATNSIAALLSANEYNLWGCEFDVQITADSIPIVYHDDSIEGVKFATNALSSFSIFRLPNGEEIPTLDSYLSAVPEGGDLVLVIELKPQSTKDMNNLLVDKSLDLLSQHDLLSKDKIVFISFSSEICERLANRLPDFTIQALFSNKSLAEVKRMGLSGIDYYQDILLSNPQIINEAHNMKLDVNVWTVNNLSDMQSLICSGVDYITTDEPLLLRSLMIDTCQ